MGESRLSDSVTSGDECYREEWCFFYAERRRLVIRLFWLVGGLAVCALLLVATQGHRFPPLVARIAIAVSFGLLLIAFLAHWFLFVWEMRIWPCPRCAKRFFVSAFAFDPFFTRRCRHCGLVRLKNAEVKRLKRKEREPKLQ
jgi:hypothetical protein